MKSLAILWNSAQNVKGDILIDLKQFAKIKNVIQLDFKEDYESFVRICYESENMEKWKIDRKLIHMSSTPSSEFTLILMDVDKGEYIYHPLKKRYVYSNLQNMKDTIRTKFKDKVKDYYFDIIFHCTDDTKEYNNLKESILKFLEKTKKLETPEFLFE